MTRRITGIDPWAPLGAALDAYHNGRLDAVVHVEADAFATEEVNAAAYYRPNDIELPSLERAALTACSGRVLDLGAGAGRHALELQHLGLPVTAVDIDPTAVRIMSERGVRDARCGTTTTVSGEVFNSILLMMNGIGIAGDAAGLDHLLSSLAGLLAPGGRIVCDSADLLEEFDEDDLENLRSASFGNLMFGEVSFRLRFGDLQGPWFPWLFASPTMLTERADAAGLSCTIVAVGERGAFLALLQEAEERPPRYRRPTG